MSKTYLGRVVAHFTFDVQANSEEEAEALIQQVSERIKEWIKSAPADLAGGSVMETLCEGQA